MTGRNRRDEAAAWLALALGAAIIGWRAYEGVDVTVELSSSESVAGAAAAFRNYECLEAQFRALVPPGSAVHLTLVDLPSLTVRAAAFPDREVVASADEADVVFSASDPSNRDLCAEGAFLATPGGGGS